MTLLWKNITRDKGRLVLLLLAVAAVYFLYGFLAAIYSVGRVSDRDASVRLITSNEINFSQPLPISHYRELQRLGQGLTVTHVTWFGGYFRVPSSFVLASAVEPVSYLAAYPEIVVDDAQKSDFFADRGSVLIGRELADRFGWAVGQQVPLQSNIWFNKEGDRVWQFRIAGIYDTALTSVVANYLLMHYAYLNETRTSDVDTVGQFVTFVPPDRETEEVVRALDGSFAGGQYPTSTVSESIYANYYLRQLGDVELIIVLAVTASFIGIVLMIVNSMMISVRERSYELAILKSVGYAPLRLFLLLFGETQSILLTGGMVGLGLAAFVIGELATLGLLPGVALAIAPWLWGLLLSVSLGLLATGLPAYRASQINVPAVFRRD